MSGPARPALQDVNALQNTVRERFRIVRSVHFSTMPLAIDSCLTMSSGAKIPQLGFGSSPETYASVTKALELGIRHCT